MIDFLGLGAQKSATSWLFQCLREHPKVCLAEEKELHYFSNDALYEKGNAWYEAHWRSCTSGQIKGEISTSYLSSPDAPARIKSYAPHAKLIALLRHPVDRAESHIRHLLDKREIPEGMSVEEILTIRPDVLENGRYASHLERYRTIFPKEQLYIDTYNHVSSEPRAVIARVDAFLGIEPHSPQALAMRYNSSAFRATALHGAANKTHKFLKQVPGGRVAISLIKSLGFTSAQLADAGHKAGQKSESLFTFTQSDRAFVEDRYAQELRNLASEGITFTEA